MHVLSSAPAGSAWTFGGSILTFAFPMILFVVVGCALYVLYTKPELVPGHRTGERPVSYTAAPGQPVPGTGDAARTEAREAARTEAREAPRTEAGE
ncbi:MAG: hypothetical protein ACRDOH_10530 [Streptosporangiaceae bacterium]